MSLIVHRCVACGHVDLFHETNDGCSHGACAAHQPVYGAPEILPTYDTNGTRVTAVAEPGTPYPAFARGTVDLCDCDACHGVYDDHYLGLTS